MLRQMERRVEIRSESMDMVSSQMMEQLGKVIEHQIPDVHDISIESEPVPDTKGVTVTLLSFLLGTASGVISAALWDLVKKVYSNIRHPQCYVWTITVFAEKPTCISVQDGPIGVELSIREESDPEDRKMG